MMIRWRETWGRGDGGRRKAWEDSDGRSQGAGEGVGFEKPGHSVVRKRGGMGINEDNWVDLVVRIKADSCPVAFLGCCCCFN